MIHIPLSTTIDISLDRLIAAASTSQLHELVLLANKELDRRQKMEEWAEAFDITEPMPCVHTLREIRAKNKNKPYPIGDE